MPATDVRLLGPVEVTLDGRPLHLGPAKQRAVFAILALRANSVVAIDDLIEGLWGEQPPATAVKLIQLHVSQLRKVLAGSDAQLVTRSRAYELRLPADAVDVERVERLAEIAARGNGDAGAAREALALWRGTPLVDVIDEPFAAAEVRRLDDLRLRLTEQALGADLDAGRHDEVIGRLDDLVREHPLRERLHALRMRALYAAGRQAEALAAFREAREILIEEVGVEPGPELRELHEAMLRQDPALAPAQRPTAAPRPAARDASLRRRLVAAATVALVAGATAFAVTRLTGPDHLPGVGENAVGRIDTGEGGLVEQYRVGREPRAVAAGAGSVWIADALDGTVSRLEPGRDRIVTIPVGPDAVALAFGGGALWVAERGDRTVAQVSPSSNKVVRRIEIANAPSALAVGFGSVWVGSAVDQTVSQIDAGGTTATRRIRLGSPPTAIAAGAGAVWVTSEESGTLFRIEPRTGTVSRAIRVGNRPVGVAAGPSGVWVANRQDATVWRIDPRTDGVTDTIAVGRDPGPIAADGSDVWVASSGDARVARIDARARRRVATIGLASSPAGLALDGDSLWVAAQPAPARHRGGTLRVVMSPLGFDSLEANAYDAQGIQVLSLAYDGLVGYRRTGGTTFGPLVGNLAQDVPEPGSDGRTYVFKLRPGIRFSDGTLVRTDDFRASVENILRQIGDNIPSFFDAVIGARQCISAPRDCDLSRGVVTDERSRTITLRLTRPDPDLLHKLANPVAFVAQLDPAPQPGRLPPGTGPYSIVRFGRTTGAELVRNPHFRVWSQDARPDGLADRIRITTVEDPGATVPAVERGAADVVTLADPFGPYLPPAEIQRLANRYPDRLRTHATPALDFMWMNVRTAPFDDVRVRRALNYAVDRRAIAELEGGETLARAACDFIAPGHPGYAPSCRYTRDATRAGVWSAPDLERARALVARSGTAGTRVTVWVPEEKRRIGRYFVSLLKRLGYRSGLRVPGQYGDYRTLVADSRARAQIGIEGWAADLPRPADFTTPFLCARFIPRSIDNGNLGGFCDRVFERRIAAARAAQGHAADARWQAVYRRLAESAPAVALVNRRRAVFVSRRIGNYQHHPLFGVLLDQLWIR